MKLPRSFCSSLPHSLFVPLVCKLSFNLLQQPNTRVETCLHTYLHTEKKTLTRNNKLSAPICLGPQLPSLGSPLGICGKQSIKGDLMAWWNGDNLLMQISGDGYDVVLLLFSLLVIDLPLSLHSEMITGQLFGWLGHTVKPVKCALLLCGPSQNCWLHN